MSVKHFYVKMLANFLVQLTITVNISSSANDQACRTPNGEIAKCISLYSCEPILRGIATREQTALNFSRDSHCGSDENGPKVCCGTHSTLTSIPKKPEISKQLDPKRLLPSRRICGYQSRDDRFDGRSIATHIDEYPWMALLYYNKTTVVECAGTLINSRYILTLADCVQTVSYIGNLTHVRLGEYDISHKGLDCIENPDYPECTDEPIDCNIEDVVVHEKFDRNKPFGDNNIALIRLTKEVIYSDYIRPICLPDVNTTLAKPGDILYASGWGLVETSEGGEYSTIKRNINGSVLSQDDCRREFRGERLIQITDSMICMKDKFGGPCLGDNGGPMSKPNKLQWHIEGIFSFGTNSHRCTPGAASVGVKVVNYVDWILQNIKP